MLEKLEMHVVRGTVYTIFETYLPNREQKIQIEEYSSDFWVPQKTVLGPVPFTLYKKQFINSRQFWWNISFADITAILYSLLSLENLKQDIV